MSPKVPPERDKRTVENVDIAAALDGIADVLQIQGANRFRVRAYRTAARTIEALTVRITDLVDAGKPLTELRGIGKEMERHILEVVETGRSRRLSELEEEVPSTVVELIRLGGLGPKRALQLWKDLQVDSVDKLEAAIRDGRLQTLKGFGQRSAEKLLGAIEQHRSRSGRFRKVVVESMVEALVRYVADTPGVEQVEVAGSYRRGSHSLGDIDLLARCDGDGAAVVARFTTFPGAVSVEAAGPTKGSVVLRSGLQVDLRVIPTESFGAALHYFTGSKEHNVKIRALAVRKKLRVNEWGVYHASDATAKEDFGERLAGATEEEVFGALGLAWIPPELREDRGEVEAARDGTLPTLVRREDLRGDLQMHSTWSDGRYSIEAMAAACRDLGYEYFALTDHSQSLTLTNGLSPERVRMQWREIEEVQQRLPEITILRSQEVDILRDGALDMPDDLLEGLDIVVASVHSFMQLGETEMTERVIRALQHPLVDVLAHPTGRLLTRRAPYALNVEAMLQAARDLNVAVELNASPNRLDLSDVHVHRARQLGVKVVISTDAHTIRELGYMRHGVEQARRGWLEKKDVLNTMPLSELRVWLERRVS